MNFLKILGKGLSCKLPRSTRNLNTAHIKPAANHPWLSQVPAPESLVPEERILTFLGANVAAGRIKDVEQDWIHLPANCHGRGMEIILQAHTLAGFPRTINALTKIHEVGVNLEDTKFFEEKPNLETWRANGRETLRAVYGSISGKMLQNFRSMHPLLESILLEHIYGRVLSRPLVDLRVRELCTVAILTGQNIPTQLISHIRGAVRCGATREEVSAVVEQTTLVWGAEALEQARAIRDRALAPPRTD